MDINKFILDEERYFEPMLLRQKAYSVSELEIFRKETLLQRKERISLEMYNFYNGIIKYGPFSGLKLNKKPWWGTSDLGSMCLGLYEIEILDFLFSESLVDRRTFIDIGAADGYYAIGLLKSSRIDKAICYEITKNGQETILENWLLNNKPGNIDINGDVFDDFLNKNIDLEFSKCIVLVDIEGAEFSFLNNDILEFMKYAIIIIEIHNWIPDFFFKYSEFLKSASQFFDINILDRKERITVDIEELRSLTDDNRLLLTSEARPCLMRFLTLKPKLVK